MDTDNTWPHITTQNDYERYEKSVKRFFESTGLSNLSLVDNESEPEPEFSHHYCECCHRSLGGDRYICHGYIPREKEISAEYSICVDCYYYAEYGQLDDMTMMDIDKVEEQRNKRI